MTDFFLQQAGVLNISGETELYKRVSQASKSVRDSVPYFAISTFPSIHEALEEYSLYVTYLFYPRAEDF